MKVSPSVERIDGTMANAYTFSADGKIILVDAGTKGSGKKIISFFKQKGSKPDIVLITHYHPDHIGGLKEISDAFSPMIYMPDREVDVATGKARIKPASSFMSKFVAKIMRIDPVTAVEPASSLSLDGVEVIETPGHTPGSTSYFLKEDGVIFVGDAVVNSHGSLKINKGFTLDIDRAEQSKQLILDHEGSIILSGHGEPFKKKG
ncbi:MAG: MBL fold metallo-hydrolase [Candidatus Thermoplasmatota archaeon]|nr:MBL fold metallo-hydrolase [Candidatus Thermoplasmatota archaeon]